MKQFEFNYVEIRRVLFDACKDLFKDEALADIAYMRVCKEVEDFLGEHIKEGKEND